MARDKEPLKSAKLLTETDEDAELLIRLVAGLHKHRKILKNNIFDENKRKRESKRIGKLNRINAQRDYFKLQKQDKKGKQ